MSTEIQKHKRPEIWEANVQGIKLKLALEAFYFLYALERYRHHFTELSDTERIEILERWMGAKADIHTVGGAMTHEDKLELKRLSLEREVLICQGFIKPQRI